jgi:hypothetical protein
MAPKTEPLCRIVLSGTHISSVAKTFLAPGPDDNDRTPMRQFLEIEDHVTVPPMMYADPFYRITYLIKEEIRKHKWLEGEKGRQLSWAEARAEWTETHRKQYETFLLDPLAFPVPIVEQTNQDSAQKELVRRSATLSMLPQRSGGH